MNKYKPAKSWLKEYYKCDKSIISVDKTEYDYPNNHLNFIGAEFYLNKIIKILNKYGCGYNKITFIKSQPCIYETKDYDKPYFWNYNGTINIMCKYDICLNKKSICRIKYHIYKLNEKFGYTCYVKFNDKNIYKYIK